MFSACVVCVRTPEAKVVFDESISLFERECKGRRRHTPGAKAPMTTGFERAKAKALAYLEAREGFARHYLMPLITATAFGTSKANSESI